MMKTTDFIWNAAGQKRIEKLTKYLWIDRQCCFCGEKRIGDKGNRDTVMYAKNDVFGDSFANWGLLKAPYSEWICGACAFCLTREIRLSSFVATESQLIKFKKGEIEYYIFNPPDPPFAMAITYSYKKHLAIRARISMSKENYHIRIEEKECWFAPAKLKPLYDVMLKLYAIPESEKGKAQPRTWFTKAEMLTGNYRLGRIMAYGRDNLYTDEAMLKPYRGQIAFELLVYALNLEL